MRYPVRPQKRRHTMRHTRSCVSLLFAVVLYFSAPAMGQKKQGDYYRETYDKFKDVTLYETEPVGAPQHCGVFGCKLTFAYVCAGHATCQPPAVVVRFDTNSDHGWEFIKLHDITFLADG